MSDERRIRAERMKAQWAMAVDRKGYRLLQMFLLAARNNSPAPAAAVRVLADAFSELMADGPSDPKLRRFAKKLGISRPRGRPGSDGFDRAYSYWLERCKGLSRAEALDETATTYRCDIRTIERDVHDFPDVEAVAREIFALEQAEAERNDK